MDGLEMLGFALLQLQRQRGREDAVCCSPTGSSCFPGAPEKSELPTCDAELLFGRCAQSGPWKEVCSWVMGRGEVARQANLRPSFSSNLLQGEYAEISASRARAGGIHGCTHARSEVETTAAARRPLQRQSPAKEGCTVRMQG